ncbi:hypothetical protein [Arthrobacter sp. NPDC056727]|uniref:hypothetical protein n=1 Tax=Arthrobacter sp. NPDC056727 TaxID=3345927 RepID=UPI00367140EA
MYKSNKRQRPVTVAAPIPNWSKLSKNDEVQVRFADGSWGSGAIDMIAPDRSVFWMIQHDGAGRKMLCYGDGASVTKIPTAGQSGHAKPS